MFSSQSEIVQQATEFLSEIAPQDYTQICRPHLSGSAGMHMRHILDHYQAMITGATSGHIDYNVRSRYSEVERCPKVAIQKWQEIALWLQQLQEVDLERELTVSSEISLHSQRSTEVRSTLAREMLFVSSHAIHHFSLLSIIRTLQGKQCPAKFGIAPATASFSRQQA